MGGSLVSLLGHCGRFNYVRDESAPRPIAPENDAPQRTGESLRPPANIRP
jgi:hypothetical protein